MSSWLKTEGTGKGGEESGDSGQNAYGGRCCLCSCVDLALNGKDWESWLRAKRDGLAGYRLGSAARRTQHRRVEGGVQEAAVRRAADALDVELLQQCQLRAGWASVNWIHSAAHSADISSFSPLGKMALRKKCIRPC